MNTLIKNGTIIGQSGGFEADIFISNGVIAAIGMDLPPAAGFKVIDAQGGLILPGGVDVHTHMDLDLGNFRVADDFYTGTVAAVMGGTTTIVDHLAFGPEGCSLQSQIEHYHTLAYGKAVIDYSFHGMIQHVNEDILKEMEKLVSSGIPSFKIYMTYDNRLQDEEILRVLIKAKNLGAVIAVHAENDGAIRYLRQHYAGAGKKDPVYHALSRPDAAEAEAINRMIYLSEMAGYPHLYFVHVSTKKGLEEIILARKRGAENIYCETCPQYLLLTEEMYRAGDEGCKYIMAPPLRKREDVEALWRGIENGDVDVIATDHCPFLLEEKLQGREDFRMAPGGVAGVEERIELILTEGTRRGIPIQLLVDKLSTRPAEIFGLYPRKGALTVGADADILILQKKKRTISLDNRHSACDYTIYRGFEVEYTVDRVLQRGKLLVEDGRFIGNKGEGAFLKRSIIAAKG